MFRKFALALFVLCLLVPAVSVFAADSSSEQLILKTLQQIDKKYPLPDEAMRSWPKLYAAEIAKYDLNAAPRFRQ